MKLNKISLAVLCAISLSQHAFAADEPLEVNNDTVNTDNIEKIEVTGSYFAGYNAHSVSGASRLDLAIIDIPQSVSVITEAQMQDFQLHDINAALDSATGVNVERIETDRTYYTARGFDITNFQIDGIGLPLTSGNNHADEDTAIYDRIEVIRGANGLMTGVGNPSATINFIRKRPTADNQLTVSGTYGSFNNTRIEADGSVRLNDTFAARAVAVTQSKDSYLDRYETDKNVFYVFLEANLTDDTSLSLSHSYINNDATGNNWGALPLFYTDGSATNYDSSTNTSADWSNWQVIKNNTVFELSHHFNSDWRLRATYSHKTTDEDTELFYVFGTPNKDTELGLTGYGSEYDLDDQSDLVDIYVDGNFSLFGREHQLVAGVNYSKMSYTDSSLYDYTTDYGFPEMPDLNTWDGNTPKPTFIDGLRGSDVIRKQQAAYFTGRFSVVDDLHVIVGGRYNDWQAEGESYEVNQDADYDKFIPYLGAVYSFTPELVAYASYTENFVAQTEADSVGVFLDPITGESREVGVKSELFNGRLIASLAYFDVEQTNIAVLDPETAGLPIDMQTYYGADGISSTGFEFEVAGEIYPGLNASIGYTDFDIEGDDTVAAYTPSKLLKFAATYDFETIEGLSIGMNMRWQDDISRNQGVVAEGFDNAGTEIITKQDAYAVIDLMAKYQISENLGLAVNANNVGDEKYINSLYWAQGYYGAPANYSATLSWKM
ncbi:ligand-gated channel protein [Shewanella algicola]|uniref:TonB-dependent siderophore receptor n=1 Tax=Shewanella algicola TaxID=640633 RepID=A0A9X1Z3U7_9GAMM|nr:TonB-dependent siderophore receptor [Shewanella algicola]MCL1104703.1 TonB-dependent siderophore receptor [Shewanella algicola]GGP45049.1 ligand-gated channel protein [Shewanella algicola]